MTHATLIEAAAKWLQVQGCAIVITDMTHGGSETPDAIGWRGKHSILVECKTSRADFAADAKKSFRRHSFMGMGGARYFCVPKGLIRVAELPDGWGLLECGEKIRKTVNASMKPTDELGAREEISLLASALRRVAKNAPAGVSVKCYTFESKNRATLGVEAETEEAEVTAANFL